MKIVCLECKTESEVSSNRCKFCDICSYAIRLTKKGKILNKHLINCITCKKEGITFATEGQKCVTCIINNERDKGRKYKAKNKELIQAYNKEYKVNNRDSISLYNHQYNKDNREKIREKHSDNHYRRLKSDMNYNISTKFRTKFVKYCHYALSDKPIKKSSLSFDSYIGCNRIIYLNWIKFYFQSDMSLENRTSIWEIDHIIPISYFNLNIDTELYLCFNWINTRPYYTLLNKKRRGVTINELLMHEIKLKYFLKHFCNSTTLYLNYSHLVTKLLEKSNNGLS